MINSKKSLISNLYKYAFVPRLVLAICFVINLLNAPPLQAQKTKDTVQPSSGQLNAFEGYYQFQNDKEAFLQITAKGNNLVLKQLWDEEEIVFERESALEFICKEKSFPLKFTKDKDGAIAQVLAFNRDLWDRVKEYKPVIKKEAQLTPQQLKACEGKYKFQFEAGKDDFLQITAKGNNLILKQAWDGKEIVFVPESELEFFCKEQKFPLKFIKDKDGTITQVLAFNRDLWNRVKE